LFGFIGFPNLGAFLISAFVALLSSVITLTIFISIVIWRSSVQVKVWGKDTILILVAEILLLGISSFAFFVFFLGMLAQYLS